MDIISFKNRMEHLPNGRGLSYVNQYNDFWTWKIGVEHQYRSHILDSRHVEETCTRLLKILPRWQTYRGVKCNLEKELPDALTTITVAYDLIRRYSLLEFHQIPDEPLRLIWDTLGNIKENNRPNATNETNTEHFVIAVSKPLMFMWGQTLAFDSINRINIRRDKSLLVAKDYLGANRWSYLNWKYMMLDFQGELLKHPEIIAYCEQHSLQVFSSGFIPYGRYLDLYYYYQY
jgi:hypothetical protein